jgi:hypothetical protein
MEGRKGGREESLEIKPCETIIVIFVLFGRDCLHDEITQSESF